MACFLMTLEFDAFLMLETGTMRDSPLRNADTRIGSNTAKDPFLEGRSTRIYQDLNIEAMNEGAKCLVQKTDFKAFCKVGSLQKTTICDVRHAQWQQVAEHRLRFDISADRFLRKHGEGCLWGLWWMWAEVGWLPGMVEDVLHSKDRSRAGMSAAACGLYLSRIDYPFIA